MRKPDFFIVGAPKCGTTALCDYLRQHPEIYMPKEKETHHFASDLIPLGDHYRSIENYLKIFSGADHKKLVGESSVFYLYSKEAAYNIYKFNKGAKIIIIIRNPVDMIYSYHSQLVFNGDENILDLKIALNAEQERKKGNLIPKNLRFKERLFYCEVVFFSEQIKRYFDMFDRDHIKVIIYDDFKKETAKVYKETLEFLGVEPNFQPDFKIINPNKQIRNKTLHNLLNDPPLWLKAVVKIILPRVFRETLINRLMRFNIKYVPRPKMSPKLKRQLIKQFSPEVERLSFLLGRDLRHWSKE